MKYEYGIDVLHEGADDWDGHIHLDRKRESLAYAKRLFKSGTYDGVRVVQMGLDDYFVEDILRLFKDGKEANLRNG